MCNKEFPCGGAIQSSNPTPKIIIIIIRLLLCTYMFFFKWNLHICPKDKYWNVSYFDYETEILMLLFFLSTILSKWPHPNEIYNFDCVSSTNWNYTRVRCNNEFLIKKLPQNYLLFEPPRNSHYMYNTSFKYDIIV